MRTRVLLVALAALLVAALSRAEEKPAPISIVRPAPPSSEADPPPR